MPSFSILRRNIRDAIGQSSRHAPGPSDDAGDVVRSTGRRRLSKRGRFHGLLNRTRGVKTEAGDRGSADGKKEERSSPLLDNPVDPPPSSPPLSDAPRSPLSPNLASRKSPLNSNKPLPSPPPLGSPQAADPPAKPVLKLNRIMATLSDGDLERLFSGAPQYFARSEGHFTGAPHPSVAFPWDEVLEIRDLTDHAQIEDEAWRCVTAWPHITRDLNRRRPSEKKKAHFYPRCRERPNMLSMQGLEKATMGYQAALEISVADALQEDQRCFSARNPDVVAARQKLLASRSMLRRVDEVTILDQLLKNQQRYQQDSLGQPGLPDVLYHELFNNLLLPPARPLDRNDPYALRTQIRSLVTVLASANCWVDFSHVEWRIRLGQLLWGMPEDDDVEDGAEIGEAETEQELREERYWLLLQILLACELLIRLDAITEGEELGLGNIRPSEIHRFERDANGSVKWSLLLARSWLENIVVTKVQKGVDTKPITPPAGWLASLTSRLHLSHESTQQAKNGAVFEIRGRYGERQVDGLTHFARKLRWPNIEAYATRISERARSMCDDVPWDTPRLTTPRFSNDGQSSCSGRSEVKRTPSTRPKITAALHPAGWISKSYVSGLVLPGETISHLLMATLLENDTEALTKLGPAANLCGGFVYGGKSFWSTQCIVGRVLGAGKGASECMGWISTDVIPSGIENGWVNIDSQEVQEDTRKTGKNARLWAKTDVERESYVLGDADSDNVLPADFIIPFERIYKRRTPKTMTVSFKSLSLVAPVDGVNAAPMLELATSHSNISAPSLNIRTYLSSISFYIASDESAEQELTFNLNNDVYFVTAHPCVPSNRVKIVKSPSSPTIQQIDTDNSFVLPSGRPSSTASVTGHPLHKYHTYTSIHLSELLARRNDSLDDLLTKTEVRRPSLTPAQDKTPRVLVVDCITGFKPAPQAHEMPPSPIMTRKEMATPTFPLLSQPPGGRPASSSSATSTARRPSSSASAGGGNGGWGPGAGPNPLGVPAAGDQMHHESRRRQFGSDMEMLVRALCVERGWNALISRRRRGCLACAIREASALGWKLVVRVD